MSPNQKLKKQPETVSAYIAKAPTWAKGTLKDMRRAIQSVSPKLKESISYHIPYYSYNGRVGYFSVAKAHCSFFWISAANKKMFKKELASQVVVGQTLRVMRGKKAPVALIKKIIRERMKQNDARKK